MSVSGESGGESNDDDTTRVSKRKAPARGGRGRVKDGEDFWGLADTWFEDKTDKWGEEYNNEGWKRYVLSGSVQVLVADGVLVVVSLTS